MAVRVVRPSALPRRLSSPRSHRGGVLWYPAPAGTAEPGQGCQRGLGAGNIGPEKDKPRSWFFSPFLTETQAALALVVCSPPPRDFRSCWPPPAPNRVVPAELRRTRRVHRQEKLQMLLFSPPSTRRERWEPAHDHSIGHQRIHTKAPPSSPGSPNPAARGTPGQTQPRPWGGGRCPSHRGPETSAEGSLPGCTTWVGKPPGLAPNPAPRGSNPFNYPGPPTPDPPTACSRTFSCLLRSSCPTAALRPLSKPAHGDRLTPTHAETEPAAPQTTSG